MIRFLDTDRLLPDPASPIVSTVFKDAYNATHLDASLEFGYAYFGAGPFYSFASSYHGFSISHPNVPNMICPQIPPTFNAGMTEVSFRYEKGFCDKEQFYGTYYQGWRYRSKMGIVVTNMVTGMPFNRINDVHTAKLGWSTRGARFQGAFTFVMGNEGRRRLGMTVCGYYGGLSNVSGKKEWKIKQGKMTDAGMNYARMAGLRHLWQAAKAVPYQVSRPVWKQVSKILRAYTGYVIQSAGSSSNFDRVWLLANGNWEQVFAADYIPRATVFEETLSNPNWALEARGCERFHMVDLLDIYTNRTRLEPNVSGWNSSHPNFVGNMMELKDLEVSSLNGDETEGTWKTKITLPNFEKPEVIAAIAKCKTICGGHRMIKSKVKAFGDKKNMSVIVTGNQVHNQALLEMDSPTTDHVQFENLFVVSHGVAQPTEDVIIALQSADDIDMLNTLTKREIADLVSFELFPNSEETDEGMLPAITSVVVGPGTDCLELQITTADKVVRTVEFMPVSHLLVDRRDMCIDVHKKTACSCYGYGYVNKDPFGGEWPMFYIQPSPTAYGGQEHWHVPYKELIGESYRIATGVLSDTTWQNNDQAKANDYIHKDVSGVNPANRYTAFDLQMRPFTFLPLFMSAEMCHESGATALCKQLAKGFIKYMSITNVGTAFKFGITPPSWVTDEVAYHESIVTLLLMAGYNVESYTTAKGNTGDVEYDSDNTLIGSPSDAFWVRLAQAAGVNTVSDLITSSGVAGGVAQIPYNVLVAAAGKDPLGFARDMGISVIDNGDDTYNVGPVTYGSKAELITALADTASNVIAHDKSNVQNVLTVLGMDTVEDLDARPKKYAKDFNWLMLLPHVATATALTVTKVREGRK